MSKECDDLRTTVTELAKVVAELTISVTKHEQWREDKAKGYDKTVEDCIRLVTSHKILFSVGTLMIVEHYLTKYLFGG